MATVGMALFPEFPPPRYQALAQQCEALGYSRIWVPDERFWREVAVCMSQVAMATKKVNIASAVTDPFIRHPALTAQMMASLDELSGGRVQVGIGAGIAGFAALGLKRDKPTQRIREAVELMRQLWTGEPVDYHGEQIQFNSSRLDWRPIRPRIPFYIAGRGPQVLKLAGRTAEGVLIGSLASPAAFSYAMKHVDAGLKAGGRTRADIDIAIWLHTAISADGEAAREAVRSIVTGALLSSIPVLGEMGLEIPQSIVDAMQGVTYGLNNPDMLRVRAMVTGNEIQHFAMAGTPEQCRAQVRRLIDAGVTHFGIVPWVVPGQTLEQFITTFAETVGTTF